MGLFDGVPAERGRTGASADVAASLGMPVLLVIDVSGQAQSAAAIVKGCVSYDARLKVGGVIVNRVGSERHRRLVVEAIEALGVPVVGALPRDDKVTLPERHLGLVQAGETEALDARLEAIADFIEAHVDCSRVLVIGRRTQLRCVSTGAGCRSSARTAHCARLGRGLLVHLSASPARLAGGRGRDRFLFAARRRAAAFRLRRVLASGRLSGIARRAACGGGAVS